VERFALRLQKLSVSTSGARKNHGRSDEAAIDIQDKLYQDTEMTPIICMTFQSLAIFGVFPRRNLETLCTCIPLSDHNFL
jgi:hypothetical protein